MSLKNLVEGQCGSENALVNLSRQLQQNLGGFPSSAARWLGNDQQGVRDEVIFSSHRVLSLWLPCLMNFFGFRPLASSCVKYRRIVRLLFGLFVWTHC